MIYVFIGIAVVVYGVYLFKTIRKSKQEKINKNSASTCASECEKVENQTK